MLPAIPAILAPLLAPLGAALASAFVKMVMAAATDRLIMRMFYETAKYAAERTPSLVDNQLIREWGVNMGFEKPEVQPSEK